MMRSGWRIALSSLRVRRGRTLLLILAVALATGLVVTDTITIDSVESSLRASAYAVFGKSDLRVQHQAGDRISGDLLETVRQWPEVQAATPVLVSSTRVTNKRTGENALYNAVGIDPQTYSLLHPLEFIAGGRIEHDNEAIVDARLAKELSIKVGDTVTVGDWGRDRDFTVAGIHERVSLAILQHPEIRISLKALQEIAGISNQVTNIDIGLKKGSDARSVLAARSKDVTRPVKLVASDLVLTGFDKNLGNGTRIVSYISFLLSVLAAGFIILTGMTTAITQKIRELGVIRCIGGTRATVFMSQVITGGVLGVAGGVLGLPLGLVLAWAFIRLFANSLQGKMALTPGAFLSGIGAAVAAGLLGSALPAWIAARTNPMVAVRIESRRVASWIIPSIGVLCLGGLAAQYYLLRGPGDEQAAFWAYIIGGLPILIISWFTLAVPILRLIAQPVSSVVTRLLRLPGNIVGPGINATPFRHGFTAGALMLGLGAMVAIHAVGSGLLANVLDRIQFPDSFVESAFGVRPEVQDWIKQQPWAGKTCRIGLFKTEVQNQHLFGIKGVAPERVTFVSFDPQPFFDMTHVDWVQGDRESAIRKLSQGGSILVAREFLTARHIGVGDTLTLGPADNPHTFNIVGVVSSPGLDIATNVFGIEGEFYQQAINCVFGTTEDAKKYFGYDSVRLFQFEVTDKSISDKQIGEDLQAHVGAIHYGSGRMITAQITTMVTNFLTASNAIGIAALVIAALGMANVISANVTARRFEYGVLRSIGADRSVMIRLVLADALVISTAACIAGIGLGFCTAYNASYLYRIMIGFEAAPAVPLWDITLGVVILFFFALAAAWPTAQRLGRHKPIELLQRS